MAPLTRQLVLSLGCATFWTEYGYHPHTPAAPRELMPVGPRLLMQLATISSDRSLSATCDALGRGRSLQLSLILHFLRWSVAALRGSAGLFENASACTLCCSGGCDEMARGCAGISHNSGTFLKIST